MKKKTTSSITKGDFDRAVKQSWSGRTCIVAQFMMRKGIEICSPAMPAFFASKYGIADKTTDIFDYLFKQPGDQQTELREDSTPLCTPMPWRVTASEDSYGFQNYTINGRGERAHRQGNARLISAAPALLEACKKVIPLLDFSERIESGNEVRRLVIAAITAATQTQQD